MKLNTGHQVLHTGHTTLPAASRQTKITIKGKIKANYYASHLCLGIQVLYFCLKTTLLPTIFHG